MKRNRDTALEILEDCSYNHLHIAYPQAHEDVTDCKRSTFRGNTTRIWGI